MKDRLFFDTNIILYAYDESEPGKKLIAGGLLGRVFSGEIDGVVSNQVLGELFSSAVRKRGVPVGKARIIVQSLIASGEWQKVNYSHATVKRAVDRCTGLATGFWDAVIAETMLENGIDTIMTENVKDYRRIPGIKAVNPFR